MNNYFKKITFIVAALSMIAVIHSCVKKDFDEPPAGGVDPVMTGTQISIATLKAAYGGIQVTDDVYIVGSVIADDLSGNFYKEVVIQDSSSGISIIIDQSNFNTVYKTGRRVFVKCKGLYLQDYNGLMQMGGYIATDGTLGRIPASLVSTYLLPGSYYHYVTPQLVHISQIDNSMLDKLITIDSVEFDCISANTYFADAINKQDVNLNIEDCSNNVLLVRTSGYSTFANTFTPGGKGTITGVLQVYSPDFQLKIRDLNDISMKGVRCDSSAGVGTSPLSYVSETFDKPCGWKSIITLGSARWEFTSYGGNFYAQAQAYKAASSAVETWLISPPLKLSDADTLTFESAMAYWKHDGLSVYISTNFDGQNVNAATWTPLTCSLAGQSGSNYTFYPSGEIYLTSFSGTGYIGFKYVGNNSINTSTFQIDNFLVH